jgi:membrane-anchored protein YejM (alkaline phosphatase superfamily)
MSEAAARQGSVPVSLPEVSQRRRAIHVLICLTALNVALMLWIGHGYLQAIPDGTSWTGWLAALTAFLSNTVMLCAAPAIMAAVPAMAWPRPWLVAVVSPILFFLINIIVYSDTVICDLYHCHFNGMVWNLMTTPGAEDTLTIPYATKSSAFWAYLGIAVVEAGLAWVSTRERSVLVARKACWWVLAAALALVIADKAVFAHGDLTNDVERLRVQQWFPFYQAVTVKRLARKFGAQIAPREPGFLQSGTTLDYPKAVALPKSPRRLNIVMVALEGARFDMLDPAIMPRLTQWSRDHLVFANHYSGGNCTRYGIFTMLYGLHGTYWKSILSERRGPFLLQALKQMGYAIQIQSVTDLDNPEFRQCAFVDVLDSVTDRWQVARVDRDARMSDNAVAFMRDAQQPFFTFLFYDASHAPYTYPVEHEVFTPVIAVEDIDYVAMAREKKTVEVLRPLFNRYRNSMHYVDAQIGKILDQLEQGGLLDNTLVLIAGDHGEEFGEMGSHGHNANFDRYQTQSLMVAHIPGVAARTLQKLTSHVDFVPTIMQEIGVVSPLGEYCQGEPLLAPSTRDHVVCASWDTAAIIDGSATIVVGTESYKPFVDIFDAQYRPMPGASSALKQRQPMMLDLLKKMGEFSK